LRTARTLAAPLLAAVLLAACRNDSAPQRSVPASPPAATSEGTAAAETELTLTGSAAFQGPTPVHCALSDQSGLQINFRTGDADTPAVAVRVDDYRGNGPYAARVFVTGRSVTGGLVTSTGEAHLEVRQSDPSAGGAVVLLSGKLDGSYQGEAGEGTIAGRFASCGYSKDRNALLQEAAGAILVPTRAAGDASQPAGDAEDTLGKPGDSKQDVSPKDVETLPARPRHPAQATGTAGRLHRRGHRAAHHRRRR
jgi:hypothetical protein